jgi:hypothetical protein
MEDARVLNRKYETIAWGAFFIWLGVTNLLRGLPEGTGALGIGVILLGLNLARYVRNIPTSGVTIFLRRARVYARRVRCGARGLTSGNRIALPSVAVDCDWRDLASARCLVTTDTTQRMENE